MKPSKLLKDVDFNFEESEESLGPHIALTLPFQGGAASGYNKPLLFKAELPEVTPELINKLKEIGVDTSTVEINKALTYGNKKDLLNSALRDKEFLDRWDYYYITDFDETQIIFYSDEGMFSVGYSMDGLNVELDDVAEPVVLLTQYEVVDGEVLISEDVRKEMKDELQAMVLKASNVGEVKDKILKYVNDSLQKDKNSVIKSEDNKSEEKPSGLIKKENGEPNVDLNEILKGAEAQEILKGLIAEATKAQTEQLAEVQKALTIEKSRSDALVKAEQTRIEKAYTDVVKSFSFVEEEKVEALVKCLIADAENSGLIVEVLTKAAADIEQVKSEFAKEKGIGVKSEGAKNPHEGVMKAAEALKASQNK